MTSTEKAKAIRAALKEAGITSKQVSVRHRYCGYSSSYHITIKDGNVSELQIKDICKRFESVDYDERTGENALKVWITTKERGKYSRAAMTIFSLSVITMRRLTDRNIWTR